MPSFACSLRRLSCAWAALLALGCTGEDPTLWVLAREPSLPRETYAKLVDNARGQGFSVDQLELTPQSTARTR